MDIKKNITALSLVVVAAVFCVTGLGLPGTVAVTISESITNRLKRYENYILKITIDKYEMMH